MTYIIFDADNTLYELNPKKAYFKMFQYIAMHTNKSLKEIEQLFLHHLEKVKKEKNPEKRRREYLIKYLFPEVNEKEAVAVFWNNLEIKPSKNIFYFLNSMLSKDIKGIIISEEFKQPLVRKLYEVFGKMWKEYFKIIISADDASEMKPSLKYYGILEKEYNIKPDEVIVAIGDDYEKDLAIPKRLNIKTAIYNKQDTRADIWFQDYKVLEKAFLKF